MLNSNSYKILQTRMMLNQRGQGLIQSIFAAGIIMLILAAAAPLGQNSARLLAKMRFNAAVNELRDTLIAVTTNTALSDPANGTNSWLLPIGQSSPVWPGTIINSQAPIPVMVVLPYYDSNQRNIELIQYGTPANEIPTSPVNPPGDPVSSWTELNGQTAADALQINGLEFVPNAPAPGYNPVQGSPGTGYTVSGTLQFSASLVGGDGTIATSMQTALNIQVLMNKSFQPLGIQVMNSKQQACYEYGGVYDNGSGQCRFGFVSTRCGGGQYISQFNSLGQASCQTLHLVCPNFPNATSPAILNRTPLNLPEALNAVINGQAYCTPVVSPQGVYFAQNSELVAQGSGPLTSVKIDLSQGQATPLTLQVAYTGGQNGYDYVAPPSPITVTVPAGATSAPIPNFLISNSGNGNVVVVTFSLVSNPPTSPSLANFSISTPNATYLTIGPAITPACQSQPISWVDQTTNETCNGNLTPFPSGQPETISGTNASGDTGSATFPCNSNGQWGPALAGATCTSSCYWQRIASSDNFFNKDYMYAWLSHSNTPSALFLRWIFGATTDETASATGSCQLNPCYPGALAGPMGLCDGGTKFYPTDTPEPPIGSQISSTQTGPGQFGPTTCIPALNGQVRNGYLTMATCGGTGASPAISTIPTKWECFCP